MVRIIAFNFQVCVSVYDDKGALIENVVSMGCGFAMSSEHLSTVYFHNANPKWNEVIKLSIPIDKVVVGSTIRFTFKHRSTTSDEKEKSVRIFSVAYLNLIDSEDGTFLHDGVHELAVYKCEGKKHEDDESYLKLPSMKSEIVNNKKTPANMGHYTFNKTDSFKVTTKLCSTKLAQNVDLLALLKWRSQKHNLDKILSALVNKVSGEEIVKFLQDTFDALFAILMEDAEKYGMMVADAVVFCIGLLADKKYHRFRPVIDAYLENLFSSTKAYITLVSVFQTYLKQSTEPNKTSRDSHDPLKKYYKSLEYYIKFVVRSRVLSEGANPGFGAKEFKSSLQEVLRTIVNIMKMMDKNLVIIQGCALKYFPAVFGDLLQVYDAHLLGHFAKDLIESIPQDRLLTPKLTSLHHMVKSAIFQNQVSRRVIMPMLTYQLKTNMSNFEELQICADILNEMLSRFGNQFDFEMGDCDDDIEYLVSNLFRCNVETVIRMDLKGQRTQSDMTVAHNLKSTNNLKGNYVAFIVSMLDIMKEQHYSSYISSYKDNYALLDALMELFVVFREFVRGNVYPSDWVSMKMIQNNVILAALRYFSEFALCDRFLVGDNFQIQLWEQFFQLGVAFITQESLQVGLVQINLTLRCCWD